MLGWCGLSAVDPALTAEVVLRLALVFEASAALDDKTSKSYKAQKLDAPQEVDAVSMITSAKGGLNFSLNSYSKSLEIIYHPFFYYIFNFQV